MLKIGLKLLRSDPCIYVYYTDGDSINNNTANTSKKPEAIPTVYFHDLMPAGGGKAVLKMLKEKPMMRRVAKTNMGDISLVRGMQVTGNCGNGKLTISQAD